MNVNTKTQLSWPTIKQSEFISYWAEELEEYSTEQILAWAIENFPAELAMIVSSSPNSAVLVSMISEMELPVHLYFVDTGYHFQETYDYIERLEKKYKIQITRHLTVRPSSQNHNFDSVYQPSNPYSCCYERRIKATQKILEGYEAVICGFGCEKEITKVYQPIIDWDAGFKVIRVDPLFYWSKNILWEKIRAEKIPYNRLLDQGLETVTCIPCTTTLRRNIS